MKWGQQLYQTITGAWTKLGLERRREREGFGQGKSREDAKKQTVKDRIEQGRKEAEAEKKAKARAAALAKARQTRADNKRKEEERKQHQADKEKALKSGTAEDLMKFKGELTNQEYSDAIARLNNEARIADMVKANQPEQPKKVSKWDRVKSISEKVNTATTAAESIIKGYNTFAKVYNSLADQPLPVLDGSRPKPKEAPSFSQVEADKLLKKINAGKLTMKEINAEYDRINKIKNIENIKNGNNNK